MPYTSKKYFKKGLLLTLFSSIVFSLIFFIGCTDKSFEIKIVVTGLTNGNLLPFKERFGPDKGKMLGGMAVRNSVLKKLLKNSSDQNTEFIFLDQGDLLSGTPEAYYTKGKSLVDTYNMAPCDALLVGNREFDFGLDILSLRASEAQFPFLVSNITDTNKKVPGFFKYKVEKVIRGIKFFIYGFVPDDTKDMTPEKNIKGLEILKSGEAIKNIAKEAGSADYTVLLTQLDKDRQQKEIDLLLESPVNMLTALSFDYDSCGHEKIKNRDFVKTYGYAKGSEVTVITFIAHEDTKKIEFKESRRIILRSSENSSDAPTSKAVVDYTRKIDSIMERVIGEAEILIDNFYDEESPLGNLICDVIKQEAGVEVVLQNPGGIKRPLRQGPVKARDMYDILPFDNEIVTMNLKGSDIRELLTLSIKKEFGLLQVSGIAYKFKTLKSGDTVLLEVMVNGTPLDDSRVYSVGTNSFLAGGGDKFTAFKRGTDKKIMGSLRPCVEKWISENSPLKYSAGQRIQEINE